jgi:hypothetical protein
MEGVSKNSLLPFNYCPLTSPDQLLYKKYNNYKNNQPRDESLKVILEITQTDSPSNTAGKAENLSQDHSLPT